MTPTTTNLLVNFLKACSYSATEATGESICIEYCRAIVALPCHSRRRLWTYAQERNFKGVGGEGQEREAIAPIVGGPLQLGLQQAIGETVHN